MGKVHKAALAAALASTVIGGAVSAAHAEPVSAEIVITCAETGPGIAICATAGLLLHEIVQILNGHDGFGPHGAVMQLLSAPIEIVGDNFAAASDESGAIAQLVRALLGISWADIEKYGLFGGPNSIFRKPFG